LLTELSNGDIGCIFSGFSLREKKLNISDAFQNIRDKRQFKTLTGVSIEESGAILAVQKAYGNGER